MSLSFLKDFLSDSLEPFAIVFFNLRLYALLEVHRLSFTKLLFSCYEMGCNTHDVVI